MLKKTKKITAFGTVAALALSAFAFSASVGAAGSSTVDINVNIGSVLEVDTYEATFDDVAVSLDPGSTDTTGTGSLLVTTNNLKGYYISIKNAESTNTTGALINQSNSNYTIPTGTSITAGTPAWALKCATSDLTYATGTDTIGGSSYALTSCNNSWFAVPKYSAAQAAVISTGNLSSTLSEARTTFTYGVATGANQAAGNYQTSINYTVTART